MMGSIVTTVCLCSPLLAIEHRLPFPEALGQHWVLTQGMQVDCATCPACGTVPPGEDCCTHCSFYPTDGWALDISIEPENPPGTTGWSDLGYPVLATAAGVVLFADCVEKDDEEPDPFNRWVYGCQVEILHDENGNGTADVGEGKTFYGHMATLTVENSNSVPQTVPQGRMLGLMGSQGVSTAPHLHFEYAEYQSSGWQGKSPPDLHGTTVYTQPDFYCDGTDVPQTVSTSHCNPVVQTEFSSNSSYIGFAPVGYVSSNLQSGFAHSENSDSHRVANVHRKDAWHKRRLATAPGNDGAGVFFHSWYHVDIQNFPSVDFLRNGAIIQYLEPSTGKTHTHAIRAGQWDVYRFSVAGGPNEFGYPISDEHPGRVSGIGCPNDACPAVQLFRRSNLPLGALVYNSTWPDVAWPNGRVRFCAGDDPYGNCSWQPVIDDMEVIGPPVTIDGEETNMGGGADYPFSFEPDSVSFDRIHIAITADLPDEVQDISVLVDGLEEALIPPAAVGYTIAGLESATTYSIRLLGIDRGVGPVAFSDTLQITTLPEPSDTLRLTSGISAVGTTYPDFFQFDSCITITYQLQNTGGTAFAVEQLRAEAEIYDGEFTYTRNFSTMAGSPLVMLNPGQTATYTGDNCGDTFPADQNGALPGFRLTGRIIPSFKVLTVGGTWPVSDVAPGATWLSFTLYDTFQLPDLLVTDTRVLPIDPLDSDSVTVELDVTNQGTGDFPWAVNLDLNLDGAPPSALQTPTQGLTVAETKTVIAVLDVLTAGTHHVGYTVNPGALSLESDSANNISSFLFTVDSTPVPAGEVPDGISLPGAPLTIDKTTGSDIALAWEESCSSWDTNYAIYEGTLGDFTSHRHVTCGTGGSNSATLSPQNEDAYYLVVPLSESREGSYGRGSDVNERVQGAPSCMVQELAVCEPPDPCQTTVAVFDDFNRPDSDIVGAPCEGCAPWGEVQIWWIPTDDHEYDLVIDNGQLLFPTPDGAVAFRPYENGALANDITLTWKWEKVVDDAEWDGVSVSHDGTSRSALRGVHVRWNNGNDVVEFANWTNVIASAPFTFDTSATYEFQWNIYADDSVDLWVWDSSGSRPMPPFLSAGPIVPDPAGGNWGIGNRGGARFDDFQVETPARDPSCN